MTPHPTPLTPQEDPMPLATCHYMFERGCYPDSLELVDEKDLPGDKEAEEHAREVGATYFWTCDPDGFPHGHRVDYWEGL